MIRKSLRPPRLFLSIPKAIWSRCSKSTSDNNANRKESTDTSRLEHPKIVCSTCNVRSYDVSRAGWKFFPSLVGISFATYATGISRGGGEGTGVSTSLLFLCKFAGNTVATQSMEAEKNFFSKVASTPITKQVEFFYNRRVFLPLSIDSLLFFIERILKVFRNDIDYSILRGIIIWD